MGSGMVWRTAAVVVGASIGIGAVAVPSADAAQRLNGNQRPSLMDATMEGSDELMDASLGESDELMDASLEGDDNLMDATMEGTDELRRHLSPLRR